LLLSVRCNSQLGSGMSWRLLVIVTIVVVVLLCAVELFMSAFDERQVVLSDRELRTREVVVVVPGAWRTSAATVGARGRLSRAFTQRLRGGVSIAKRLRATHLVIAGGHWDSIDAREWVSRELKHDALAPPSHGNVDVENPVTVTFPSGGETRTLLLWAENRSTTTAENAVEVAALLAANHKTVSPGADVVVVSSGYHLARCRIYFRRYLTGRRVFTVASPRNEWQVIHRPDWKPPAVGLHVYTDPLHRARATLKSLPQYRALQELVAIPHNLILGKFSVRDLNPW
jgi:hypothetical protein